MYRYIPITQSTRIGGVTTAGVVAKLVQDSTFDDGDREWLAARERILTEVAEATQQKRHYLRLTDEDHQKLDQVAAKPADGYGTIPVTRKGEDGKPVKTDEKAGPIFFPHLRELEFAKGKMPPGPEEAAPEEPEDEPADEAKAAE